MSIETYIEIQSQNVKLNGTTQFNFTGSVAQYLAGIASFQLQFEREEDHHVEQMSIQLQTNKPSSNQVTVEAIVVLQDDSGHSIDTTASYVTVTVIASSSSFSSGLLLSPSYTVSSPGDSTGITLPGPTDPILQSVLGGFYLSFGSTDHEIAQVEASVGVGQNSNAGYLKVTADMNDASGNHAVDPTASGALIATSLSDPGFVVASYTGQHSGEQTPAIPMGATITGAVSFLTRFHVQYPGSSDHHVRTIGAGPDQTTVDSGDNTKAQTSGVQAWMSDASGNTEDDTNSYASIVVVGTTR